MLDDYERLKEIQTRIEEGWRLKSDIDWLIQIVKKYLEENKDDRLS